MTFNNSYIIAHINSIVPIKIYIKRDLLTHYIFDQAHSSFYKQVDKQGSSYIKLHLILTTAFIHVWM